jgi:hypothetical protein
VTLKRTHPWTICPLPAKSKHKINITSPGFKILLRYGYRYRCSVLLRRVVNVSRTINSEDGSSIFHRNVGIQSKATRCANRTLPSNNIIATCNLFGWSWKSLVSG